MITLGRTKIKPHGDPIRIYQDTELLYTINDVPVKVIRNTMPDEDVLPPIEEGTIYIVSRLVADVYKGLRDDLVFPYDFIRDTKGKIKGCTSLARFE